MKIIVAAILVLSCSWATADEWLRESLSIPNRGNMAIGIYPSTTPTRADILYFHGHADRLNNHKQSFQRWAQQGFRTLSFDLPQHGDSSLGPLDSYSIDELAGLAATLERHTREDEHRPLVFVGWSFGGLLATYLAEHPANSEIAQRLKAMFLITPALAPLPFSGGDGISRLKTLTHNTDLEGISPPAPSSPLTTPLFAMRILQAAYTTRHTPLPNIPVTVVLAGDQNDWYVDTAAVLDWGSQQQRNATPPSVWQCQHARHALELEPYPTGHWLREFSSARIAAMLDATSPTDNEQWNGAFASTCRHAY